MDILEVKNIRKKFDRTEVLKDISFTMQEGQAVSIIGSSGSGKTTLLRCLNFLEMPDEGVIRVKDETLFDSAAPGSRSEAEIRKKRLHFGLVFQSFNLFPHLTVIENITLAPITLKKMTKELAEEKAAQLLKKVGLSEKGSVYPSSLSGGQKQRVAIARALAMEPEAILFLDVE